MTMTKFEVEKHALIGDRWAMLEVISDLRRYRAAVAKFLGGTDEFAELVELSKEVRDIEGEGEDEDDSSEGATP